MESRGCKSIHTGNKEAIAAYTNSKIIHVALGLSPATESGKDKGTSGPIQIKAYSTTTPNSDTRGKLALVRSEEHTSELQSRGHLVCRLLLEKKKHYKRR